jgi:hypothetical protein
LPDLIIITLPVAHARLTEDCSGLSHRGNQDGF